MWSGGRTMDAPVACPTFRMVLNYDQAIRDLQARLMKSGLFSKPALEAAMADPDTRTLYFTTGFSMEAHTRACQTMSAQV